jgi:site-specific DNA-methyltransferase (cytosine-N4-specific)
MLEKVLADPLIDRILAIQGRENRDFWSFKGATRRSGAHALIHYPAMMVPSLQGKLLDALSAATPKLKSILDPFVGSGTMLVESMSRGLDFTGIDINPLAVLACQVKSGPYFVRAFLDKAANLTASIRSDRERSYHIQFNGRDKWFSAPALRGISRIARNIEKEPQLWARRLFWLALAKVVRVTCNSRMSTYKLHIKEIAADSAPVNPLELFDATLCRFAGYLREQRVCWNESGRLANGRYVGNVTVGLGDTSATLETPAQAAAYDAVITSPPYGDNVTTIPYGQYAYLPMRWIPTEDISLSFDKRLLDNSHAVDSASLGGSLEGAAERGRDLLRNYPAAKQFARGLRRSSQHYKKFAAFFSDLDGCVRTIAVATRSRGYQVWTIGNRRISGRRVPMEGILSEMLLAQDVQTVGRINRAIHAKKMARRNNISDTITAETIILARKR